MSQTVKFFVFLLQIAMGDDWDGEVETGAAATGVVDIVSTAEIPEIKLFGKWSCDEVNVSDMSLQVSSSSSKSPYGIAKLVSGR